MLRITDYVHSSDDTDSYMRTIHSLRAQTLNLGEAMPGCRILSFTSCRLPELPSIACLKSTLETLNLTRCSLIQQLPVDLGEFARLNYLSLECPKLCCLPDSLGMCDALEVLNLQGCDQITQLPESLGRLKALRVLTVHGCEGLARLPESLGQLPELALFSMGSCPAITKLPQSFGKLAALTDFTVRACDRLTQLGSLSELEAILNIEFNNCLLLSDLTLSLLDSLRTLKIVSMWSLTRLPDALGHLAKLSTLYIRDLKRLTALPELHLIELHTLEISHTFLTRLPESLGNLAQLGVLELDHCEELECLPQSLGLLEALEKLHLTNCFGITWLPDSLGNLAKLRELNLRNCTSMTQLPETLGKLNELQILDVCGATRLSRLPDSLGSLQSLEYIFAENCIGLRRLPATLGRLESLVWAHFRGCSELTSPPYEICFGRWPNMREFLQRQDTLFHVFILILAARRATTSHLPEEVWGLLINNNKV